MATLSSVMQSNAMCPYPCMHSMSRFEGDFNYIEFIANSKSGQFFFYSHDGQYMIKTQSKEESQLLRQIMPSYVQHLTEHPDSLLVRFYGMHRVKFGSQRIYFVIMSSVFYTEKPIEVKFDLKGSTQGRLTPLEQCRQGAVQKDINLMSSGKEQLALFCTGYTTLRSYGVVEGIKWTEEGYASPPMSA